MLKGNEIRKMYLDFFKEKQMDFRMNVIHLETFIRVFIGLYILDSQEKIREEKIREDKGR